MASRIFRDETSHRKKIELSLLELRPEREASERFFGISSWSISKFSTSIGCAVVNHDFKERLFELRRGIAVTITDPELWADAPPNVASSGASGGPAPAIGLKEGGKSEAPRGAVLRIREAACIPSVTSSTSWVPSVARRSNRASSEARGEQMAWEELRGASKAKLSLGRGVLRDTEAAARLPRAPRGVSREQEGC
jgi:hypothetical protein